MYTNIFKNELTTDQKRKLLLNTCGIYFTVAMAQRVQLLNVCTLYRVHYYVFYLFCLIFGDRLENPVETHSMFVVFCFFLLMMDRF